MLHLVICVKLNNFTSFKLRKHFVESLKFQTLIAVTAFFHPLPDFLIKRLQHFQFTAASYVPGRYIHGINEILNTDWLPLKERRDLINLYNI